jgi:hypothetical protein
MQATGVGSRASTSPGSDGWGTCQPIEIQAGGVQVAVSKLLSLNVQAGASMPISGPACPQAVTPGCP